VTGDELDRLAETIARALIEARGAPSADAGRRESWLPSPVRPEPPVRGGEPPAWSGAAQRLDDIAPGRAAEPPVHRVTVAELTNATRAAAAGRGEAPRLSAPARRPQSAGRRRGAGEASIEVQLGISNRHVHLSAADVRTLFGMDALTAERPLSQPGQFAASERLTLRGPAGSIRGVRVVGPTRDRTQVEVAPSDCRVLGIAPPVRASGVLSDSIGDLTLEGPAGSVQLASGVIVAARHLHLSAEDARKWGIRDGDLLEVRCGTGARALTLHGVIVRAGPEYATELHLDSDEAFAAGVRSGEPAIIVRWHGAPEARRRLVTERDVLACARSGVPLPAGALLTPSAHDRARALGLLAE
jgi:putative phosphotransacetylase